MLYVYTIKWIYEELIVISRFHLRRDSFRTIVRSESCRFTFSPPRWERKTGFVERGGRHRLLCISMQTRARHGGLLSAWKWSRYIVHDLTKPVDKNRFTRIANFAVMNYATQEELEKIRVREKTFLIRIVLLSRRRLRKLGTGNGLNSRCLIGAY